MVIAASNGVVIATEKKLPSILVDETSVSTHSMLKALGVGPGILIWSEISVSLFFFSYSLYYRL